MIALSFTSKSPFPSPGFTQQKEVDSKQPPPPRFPQIPEAKQFRSFCQQNLSRQTPVSSLQSPDSKAKQLLTSFNQLSHN